MIDNNWFNEQHDELESQARVYSLVKQIAESKIEDCAVSKSATEAEAWMSVLRFSKENLDFMNLKMSILMNKFGKAGES